MVHHRKFFAWVDGYGQKALADKLEVEQSTISHWKRGRCWPRVEHIRRIRKLAKGKLSYEDIIDGCPAARRG